MKKLIISAAVMFAFAACDNNNSNSNTDQPATEPFVNDVPETTVPGSTDSVDSTNRRLNDSGQIRQ